VGAGRYNTTGYNNSAQGYAALFSNTTGYQNSAQGYAALYSNTTGYQNSAQGMNALQSNTTGYYNSAQGMQAGAYISGGAVANTVSNNSVYLGYNTKALADGDTNEIVIGADATGAGSNSATLGNTSVTQTVLRGNVTTNGTISGLKAITTHSATEAATAATMYGNVHLVTGNYTITLPTAVAGMNAKFCSTTAAVFYIDTAAGDKWILAGTATDDGDKIGSPGSAGDCVDFVSHDAAVGWMTMFMNVVFVDSGA
jgi:hypothetical protein